MKNLRFFYLPFIFSFAMISINAIASDNEACTWKSWYEYPKDNERFNVGQDVYVKVNAENKSDIAYMELYVGSRKIRKESSAPYEWCKKGSNSDSYLRKLKPGKYQLKCRIKDKCGDWNEIYRTFYVDNKGGDGDEMAGGDCNYKMNWDSPKSGYKLKAGKDLYVKVGAENYKYIKYCELYINGKLVRKESSYPYEWGRSGGNSDSYLRKLKVGKYKLKCIVYDKCNKKKEYYRDVEVTSDGGSGGDDESVSGSCNYKMNWDSPKSGYKLKPGKDLYVKVGAENYKYIKYCELYINGKLVRKESSYPYEWGRSGSSSDSYLRKLKAGKYKLKCIVYDKCNKKKEYYRDVEVTSGGGSGGDESVGGSCNYKMKWDSPKDGYKLKSGKDLYVKVGAEDYKYIKYCELYINGRLVRKESSYPYEWGRSGSNSDKYLRKLKAGKYKLKCIVYDKCNNKKEYYQDVEVTSSGDSGGGNDMCKYKSYFEYPKNNETYKVGKDVYVKVGTEKYQDIKEMKLYVNGKYLRAEKNYPYEWAKGNGNSDGQLRNLKSGTYKLKCTVETKCNKEYEYYCTFYVR